MRSRYSELIKLYWSYNTDRYYSAFHGNVIPGLDIIPKVSNYDEKQLSLSFAYWKLSLLRKNDPVINVLQLSTKISLLLFIVD